MNPEVEQKFAEMQRKIDELTAFKNAWFSAAEVDPQVARTVIKIVGTLKLSDLSDVSDTDGASSGQVLKKTATTWQPGTDNVA